MMISPRLVVALAATVVVALGTQDLGANIQKGTNTDTSPGVPQRVTLAFGTGNNNAVPGPNGKPNHHVLPDGVTKVRMTPSDVARDVVPAVVNFLVAGFHQIFVYQPGVTPDDISAYLKQNDPTNANLFINNLSNLYYTGINPVRLVMGVPTYNDNIPPPVPILLADQQNRVETVAFNAPGLYLVICNVRPHFQDGMYKWIRVVTDDDEDANE